MKIIGGICKSREIIAPKGIRPVSMRLKKACFDLLGGRMETMRVLDLFAGSGSLGLEACSRGAQAAVFVDKNRPCIEAIRRNIIALALTADLKVCLKDAFAALWDFHRQEEQFDLVFLDPPYYHDTLTKALQAIGEYDIVARFGFVIGFCYVKDGYYADENSFSCVTKRKYCQTTIVIYQKK